MLNHFEDYFKNESGCTLVTTEYGFFSYSYDSNYKNMFIQHLYVAPENRKQGKAFELFAKVRGVAAGLGAERVVGNLFYNETNKDNFTKKLMLHLRYGYEVIDVQKNCITVIKEL
jgi:GNAT superfamily N-acetyltransferase